MKKYLIIILFVIFIFGMLKVSAIEDVWCDWGNDAGNPLCRYSGHWRNLPSRLNPNTDYNIVKGDANTNTYEEHDSYATVGIYGDMTSLTNIDVAFTGVAMNWFGYGATCSSGYSCNAYYSEMDCDATNKYSGDPCTGYCSDFRKKDLCSVSGATPGGFILGTGSYINTKDENDNTISEYVAATYEIYLECIDDNDCTDDRTCQVENDSSGIGIGTACVCIPYSSTCESCLSYSDGTQCDCFAECANNHCWGNTVGNYVCQNTCASDGKYAATASECCSSTTWNSVTKECEGAPACNDNDGDGYGVPGSPSCTYSLQDCNDDNANIHPNANEICDTIDNNCAYGRDEGCDNDKDNYADSGMTCSGNFIDGNSYTRSCSVYSGDCADGNANINPGENEICNDGIDNDCDGNKDCYDSECTSDPVCDIDCDYDYRCDPSENPTVCPNDCVNSGNTCLYDNQCYDVNYCVHNKCRSTRPYCTDSYCDSGETCSRCSTDCGSCVGPEIRASPGSLRFWI